MTVEEKLSAITKLLKEHEEQEKALLQDASEAEKQIPPGHSCRFDMMKAHRVLFADNDRKFVREVRNIIF